MEFNIDSRMAVAAFGESLRILKRHLTIKDA
jgi:hypothetical protein